MKRTTLSKLDRRMSCPGSAVLPLYDTRGEHIQKLANKGHAVHDFLAQGLLTNEWNVRDWVKQHGEIPEQITIDVVCGIEPRRVHDLLGDGSHVPEVAYAYDPESGECRELGVMSERDYSEAPEGWLTGTLDVVSIAEDRSRGRTTDWKTGRVPLHVPRENWQLKGGALMVAARHKLSEVDAQLVYVDEVGDLRPGSAPVLFEDMDLAGFAYELRTGFRNMAAAEQAFGQVPMPEWVDAFLQAGEQCQYCDASHVCPLVQQSEVALVEGPHHIIKTAADAERTLIQLEAVESAVKKRRSILESFIRRNGAMPLSTGQVLDFGNVQRERVNKAALPAVIEAAEVIASDPLAQRTVTDILADTLAGDALSKTGLKRGFGAARGDALIKQLRAEGHIKKHPPKWPRLARQKPKGGPKELSDGEQEQKPKASAASVASGKGLDSGPTG